MRLDPVTQTEAERLCDSPAEAAFLTAFSAICMREAKRRKGKAEAITIKPHAWIEEFRVDFLILQGGGGLVVECDDFNSWLEPILEADRDQIFEDSNYGVYRFTSDEITADAERCAQLAFDYFDARKKLERKERGQ